MKDDSTMIDTPYGKKRWGFLKRVMDSHDELLEACKAAILPLNSARFDTAAYDWIVTKLERAIDKAQKGE